MKISIKLKAQSLLTESNEASPSSPQQRRRPPGEGAGGDQSPVQGSQEEEGRDEGGRSGKGFDLILLGDDALGGVGVDGGGFTFLYFRFFVSVG